MNIHWNPGVNPRDLDDGALSEQRSSCLATTTLGRSWLLVNLVQWITAPLNDQGWVGPLEGSSPASRITTQQSPTDLALAKPQEQPFLCWHLSPSPADLPPQRCFSTPCDEVLPPMPGSSTSLGLQDAPGKFFSTHYSAFVTAQQLVKELKA